MAETPTPDANAAAEWASAMVEQDAAKADGGKPGAAPIFGELNASRPAGDAGGDIEMVLDIPVQLTEQRRGQRFSFTLGSGGARIELQSFSGDIHLARAR